MRGEGVPVNRGLSLERKFVALLSVVGLAIVAIAPSFATGEVVGTYIVRGISGADLAARGFTVVDDYGAFATADLDASDVAALHADGFVVEPVVHTSGRGAYRVDLKTADTVPFPIGLDSAGDSNRFLVQFRGPVKTEWAENLRSTAIAVYDYLPANTFLVRLSDDARDTLAAMPEVRAIEPYLPAYKLAPELPAAGLADATVLADLDADLGDVIEALVDAGARPTAATTAQLEHVIDVQVAADALSAVAAIDAVSWIEPAYDEAGHDNAFASAITQSGATGVFTLYDKGVDGSSQVVSICDTGVNTESGVSAPLVPQLPPGLPVTLIGMTHELHDDTGGLGILEYNAHLSANPLPLPEHRKVTLYYSPQENGNRGNSDDQDGHGTHTGGTIAGDSPPYGERNGNDGVAFAAKMAICDVGMPGCCQILNNYANYWDPAYDAGARINSNSWGSAHTNVYTEKARQHDAYVETHRDFLVLRSMGNTGANGNIRPEAVAKNAMGIGATSNAPGNPENIAGFSTGGLTADGRMKPNVVAPGDCLTSSTNAFSASYACLSGTSMSTPTVAGAAALVRDYFDKGFYGDGAEGGDGIDASAALVRAVLQISGKEISGDRAQANFPNKAQGWGRVLLDDALEFENDATELIVFDEGAGVVTGETAVRDIVVRLPDQRLRIMLAWSDVAGAAGANPALVNDLDLVVSGPGGTYIGNHFVGNEVPAGAFAADNRNVEEAVYITVPAPGAYSIRVTGANVPDGPQSYVLVITGDAAILE